MKKAEFDYDVVVVGGGPAGLMSAGTAGKAGARVLLLEKNDILGKKLKLTGGGRCNLTNLTGSNNDFVSKFGHEGQLLHSPLSIFNREKAIIFFEELGLKTKEEAGGRVFPTTDSADDVLRALIKYAKDNQVEIRTNVEVTGLSKTKNQIVVETKEGKISAKNVILTTGGKSYPETGSTGEGFDWLEKIGHQVIAPNPSLVPIEVKEKWVADLAGLALDNTKFSVWCADEKMISAKGKVLFTHVGLSGPAILNNSKQIGELLKKGEVKIVLDLLSHLSEPDWPKKFLELFTAQPNKALKNLKTDLSGSLWLAVLRQSQVSGERLINSITREERLHLIDTCHKFVLTVNKLLGYDKAIISSGGVELSEIDFKTLRSKLFSNLYFAGDILNFDRPSGGYSLQLCWTTGYVAGLYSANSHDHEQ